MNWKTTQHNSVQITQLTKLHLFLCVFIYSFSYCLGCFYTKHAYISRLTLWRGEWVCLSTVKLCQFCLQFWASSVIFLTLCAWRCFPSAARETSTNDSACGTKKHISDVLATFNRPGRARWRLRPSWPGGCSISGWSTARPPHLTWRPRLKQSLFCCL